MVNTWRALSRAARVLVVIVVLIAGCTSALAITSPSFRQGVQDGLSGGPVRR